MGLGTREGRVWLGADALRVACGLQAAMAQNHGDVSRQGPVVAAAMVLRRPVLRRGFVRRMCILYVPKGPLLNPLGSRIARRRCSATSRRSAGDKVPYL